MSSIEEINILTEQKIQNITYEKIMEAMESLKDDAKFRNSLVEATQNYITNTNKSGLTKTEIVSSAYMMVIFRYLEAEVRNKDNGVIRITSVNSSNSIDNLREATKEGEGK